MSGRIGALAGFKALMHGETRSRARRAAALGLLVACLLAPSAVADTFKPTRFDDPEPADQCKPKDCSLREAVKAANLKGGRDIVVLKRGTYELKITDETTGAAGDLEIRSPLQLRGEGAKRTRIDANGIDRVMSIGCGVDPRGAVSIKGVLLRGGDPGANPDNCTVQGSSVGGAILSFGNALKLTGVKVSGNEADLGGAVYMHTVNTSVNPQLTITKSTIADNRADSGGGIFLGAGAVPWPALVRTSTISGNRAAVGGGIALDGTNAGPLDEEPKLDVVNSTVAENLATVSGGGVHAINGATATLDNSTIAYNQADSDGNGGGAGGGVRQATGAVFGLDDSVVAANTVGASGTGAQCDGSFSSFAGAVIQQQADLCTFGGGGGTIVPDAVLGALASNGGPTKTIELLAGSPAQATAVTCPAKDQRGKDRPDEDCDSGSFERLQIDP